MLVISILHEMFNDVQCEHHWSHDTHQAGSQIVAKRVPALHCQWLQQLLLFVPLAHPDLTPRDFFLWGFVKRLVYVPLISRDVDEQKAQITEATIDNAMLGRVWQELDYRLDMCCVTNGAHIEHSM